MFPICAGHRPCFLLSEQHTAHRCGASEIKARLSPPPTDGEEQKDNHMTMQSGTTAHVDASGITTSPPATAGAHGISFRITPHRSMSDDVFRKIIFAIIGLSVLAQLYFLVIGIWIAGVAFILDGLFLAGAFIACRADRKRVEIISLRDGIIHIKRERANGEMSSESLPAFGLELIETVDPDYGHRKLEMRHRHTVLEVAADLTPGERKAFVAALAEALSNHGFKPRRSERQLLPLMVPSLPN